MTNKMNMMVIALVLLMVAAIFIVMASTGSLALLVDGDLPGTLRYCVASSCTL